MANNEDNEKKINLKLPDEPRWKIALNWCTFAVSVAMAVISGVGLFHTLPDIINNHNEQTQVVIEPRDGDIIVKDGDDYKLLQLISLTDIIFPTKIQEVQHKYNEDDAEKRINVPIGNTEEWTNKDSFSYVINNFSINPNKVINLLDNIENITVFCDFYSEKNIATLVDLDDYAFSFKMRESIDSTDFEVTKSNIGSKYHYVTNEINNGFEWAKIRVNIIYSIGDRKITDTITSDWIATDADLV